MFSVRELPATRSDLDTSSTQKEILGPRTWRTEADLARLAPNFESIPYPKVPPKRGSPSSQSHRHPPKAHCGFGLHALSLTFVQGTVVSRMSVDGHGWFNRYPGQGKIDGDSRMRKPPVSGRRMIEP